MSTRTAMRIIYSRLLISGALLLALLAFGVSASHRGASTAGTPAAPVAAGH